jgi:hypothetical protein
MIMEQPDFPARATPCIGAEVAACDRGSLLRNADFPNVSAMRMRRPWPDRSFCNYKSTIGTPSVNY